jgi:hypothetical protein
MRYTLLILSLLFSSLSLARQSCDQPSVVSIPDGALSRHQAIRLQRHMYRYLVGIEEYSACVKNEYRAAMADGAPATELRALVTEHNETIAESKQLVAAYEARLGPVEELAALYSARRPAPPPVVWSQPRPEPPIGPTGPPPTPGSVEWTDPSKF